MRKAPSQWEFFNVEYRAFRLFQLAVLFRAAISAHEAFEHVSLPEVELDRMRYHLNTESPPNVGEYPCLMEVLLDPNDTGSLCHRIIGAPKTYTERGYGLTRHAMPVKSALLRGLLLGAILLAIMGRLVRQPLMNLVIGNPLPVVLVQDGISWLLWLTVCVVTATVFERLAPENAA